MTHLQLYESALVEQNKHEAPTLLIEEYNYLINKAIIQYVNLTYARFDLNQQTSDDLRWLQRSVELSIYKQDKVIHPKEEANYVVVLPSDYFHVLNCTTHFVKVCNDDISRNCPPKELKKDLGVFSLCRRLTANQFPAIINNAYLKPSYKNPYFYINTSMEAGKVSTKIGIDSILNPCPKGDCESPIEHDEIKSLDPCCNKDILTGNEGILMEILCGTNKYYSPDVAYVDYLKTPDIINLTWEDVNGVGDTTPECEFPDAVAYEIINIFMKLLFENAGDQRLQTHFAINQTVGGIPTADSK